CVNEACGRSSKSKLVAFFRDRFAVDRNRYAIKTSIGKASLFDGMALPGLPADIDINFTWKSRVDRSCIQIIIFIENHDGFILGVRTGERVLIGQPPETRYCQASPACGPVTMRAQARADATSLTSSPSKKMRSRVPCPFQYRALSAGRSA